MYRAFVLDADTAANILNVAGQTGIVIPEGFTIVNHHITIAFGEVQVASSRNMEINSAALIGFVADDKAIVALCNVNGNPHRQFDSDYHVTVAIATGVKPVYSNDVIKKLYHWEEDVKSVFLKRHMPLAGEDKVIG